MEMSVVHLAQTVKEVTVFAVTLIRRLPTSFPCIDIHLIAITLSYKKKKKKQKSQIGIN